MDKCVRRTGGCMWKPEALSVLVTLVLLATASGCAGNDVELVKVTGKVTMDGQPLADATVRFLPIVTGDGPARPSSTVTTEEGEFALGYSSTKQGARPGKYRISISTFRNPEPGLPGKPETVPLCYNKETTLTEEVTPKQYEFTFDFQSDAGKVVQPSY